MRIIADLHIHSKYSMAVSKLMEIPNIAKWADIKGINLIATGDFTHPRWFEQIKNELTEDGSGFLSYKDAKAKFVLSSEISSIYKQGDKTRKLHTLVLVPDLKSAEQINRRLAKIGNIISDGRPILKLSGHDLAQLVLTTNPESLIIPAHIWTPWFSLFGSKSGFDSIKECFGDLSKNIFAVETGISSDPEMNWRISALDKITLLSNSDAHSLMKMGREANVFEIEPCKFNYGEIADIIKTKDVRRFPKTLEFFPEEGRYHFDGHSNCKICADPFENKYPDGHCPICRKPMTIGVVNQVEKFADRKKSIRKSIFPATHHIIPLNEIIAESFCVGVNSKKVEQMYFELINQFGNEFTILLDLDEKEMLEKMPPRIAEGIINMRKGKVKIDPGYDGLYGKISIFKKELIKETDQKTLF
jgi:uncharacterized protein (TIGR00375 family)